MVEGTNNLGLLITVAGGFATTFVTLYFNERKARDERRTLTLQMKADKEEAAAALSARLIEQRETAQLQASMLKNMVRGVGSDARRASEDVLKLADTVEVGIAAASQRAGQPESK